MNSYFRLNLIVLILVLFNYTHLSAQEFQSAIEGRVLEASTGAPISNANVYISGTTWGNATDRNGYFKISLLPPGTYEIVASTIGYKSESKFINLKTNMIYQTEFKLEEANYELESVVVISRGSEEWKKNYELFKKRFLGESDFSTECMIENPEYINLEWTDANELKAETDRPIIIINNALGYKVSCELVNFLWNPNSHKIKYMVRTSFSELKDTTGIKKVTWIKNRSEVYLGSIEHFLKSVITDSISLNGFLVSRSLSPSTGKQELLHLDRPLVRADGNDYDMSFVNFIKIEYTIKDPLHPEVSWIKLLYPQVTLDNFGYPIEPDPFEIYGFWAQKGLADMLPKYFSVKHQF